MSDLNSMLSEFVDLSAMASEVEKSEKKSAFWRPTKQKTTVRILPPIKSNGEKLPFFEHKVHWINSQPYECLNQTVVDKDGNLHNATECPICKMARSLYNAKTDDAVALAKKISGKTRYVVRILVRDDPEYATTPVFYELPFSIHEKIKNAILSKEWGSLFGPLDGRDFDIVKTGEGMYTNYDASSFKPVTSKIADDNQKIVEILTKAKDMSYNSLINFKTADDIKAVAMENDDIARFFGVKTAAPVSAPVQYPAPAVSAPSPAETVVPTEELVPAAPVEAASDTSAADELDSLLAGLI